VKKGPIQGSICFKLILGLLVFGLLSKVALRRTIKTQDGIVAKTKKKEIHISFQPKMN
jgi:hypothetical protein